MATQVVWTQSALRGLREAFDFTAADSQRAADVLNDEADAAGQSLQTHSLRGRIVPEYQDDSIRELFVQSYRLIYFIRPKRILIIRFIHGSRRLVPHRPR